jgi:hypothetical protein
MPKKQFWESPVLIYLTFIATLYIQCQPSKCSNDIEQWISFAPSAFNEFQLVKSELLANKPFLDSQTKEKNLLIGTNILDTSRILESTMPYLKNWFRKGYGFIHFSPGDTTVCFRECSNGRYAASGYIKHSKNIQKYSSLEKTVDSMKLSASYYAIVTKCSGCGSE